MDNIEIGSVRNIWYLGSIIQDDGKLVDDLRYRIKAR